ncbi:hypothetical protein Tco_1295173 [Tanacetum coccineum]
MLMIRRRCVSIRNAYAFIRSQVGISRRSLKLFIAEKVFWIRANETPGWVPDFVDESEDEDQNDDDSNDGGSNVHEMGSCGGDSDVEDVSDTLLDKDGR